MIETWGCFCCFLLLLRRAWLFKFVICFFHFFFSLFVCSFEIVEKLVLR